jgi:hypothetical protein
VPWLDNFSQTEVTFVLSYCKYVIQGSLRNMPPGVCLQTIREQTLYIEPDFCLLTRSWFQYTKSSGVLTWIAFCCFGVAQLVERLAVNQVVAGSSPAAEAILFILYNDYLCVYITLTGVLHMKSSV